MPFVIPTDTAQALALYEPPYDAQPLLVEVLGLYGQEARVRPLMGGGTPFVVDLNRIRTYVSPYVHVCWDGESCEDVDGRGR